MAAWLQSPQNFSADGKNICQLLNVYSRFNDVR